MLVYLSLKQPLESIALFVQVSGHKRFTILTVCVVFLPKADARCCRFRTSGKLTVPNSAYGNITSKPSTEHACTQIDHSMQLAE